MSGMLLIRPAPPVSELQAAERADPRGHAIHACLAVNWGFLQSITNAGEGIAWGLLLAIAVARLPKVWRCYRPVGRDPLWWTVVAWAAWWALAGLWGPEIPGRSNIMLPERWVLTPLMLWPVMARPWLVLGAIAIGGAVQSASVAFVSWDGSGWAHKQNVPGLSSLAQSQWQTVTALVLSACALRFGSWPVRIPAVAMLACSTLAVLILAVRTMAAAALAGVAVAFVRTTHDRRSSITRLAVACSVAASALAALLFLSPAGRSLRTAFSDAALAADAGADAEALSRLSSFRLVLAHAAIDIGREHPFLGGGRGAFLTGLPRWGLGEIATDPSLATLYERLLSGSITDAHNAILQAWVDGGIPAATLLAALLAGLALRLWRQSRTSPVACTALALYSIVLVNVPGGIVIAKSPGAIIAVCLAVSWLGLGYRVANPITGPGA